MSGYCGFGSREDADEYARFVRERYAAAAAGCGLPKGEVRIVEVVNRPPPSLYDLQEERVAHEINQTPSGLRFVSDAVDLSFTPLRGRYAEFVEVVGQDTSGGDVASVVLYVPFVLLKDFSERLKDLTHGNSFSD